MLKQPDIYIYLDKGGIESLFSQTADQEIVEIHKRLEKSTDEKAGIHFGIGKALAALLGIEVGADIGGTEAEKHSEEAKITLSTEHKLDRLQKYLFESNRLFEHLNSAIRQSFRVSPVFIRISDCFDMPQFIKGKGFNEVNEERGIIFSTTNGIDLLQFVEEKDGAIINNEGLKIYNSIVRNETNLIKGVMATSLQNFTRLRSGNLHGTTHDGIYFESYNFKEVPFNLFGYIVYKIGGIIYQIKPYAIWL